MPAATVTGRQQSVVVGNLRRVGADSIAFAASGDTFTAPGMKRIYQIDLTPTTNVSAGFTVAGNVITIVSAGAVTLRGGVLGL